MPNRRSKTIDDRGNSVCCNPDCAKPLVGRTGTARWCTPECSRKMKKAIPISRLCRDQKCGKSFKPSNPRKMFCSTRCRRRYRARMYGRRHRKQLAISRRKYLASHMDKVKATRASYKSRNKLKIAAQNAIYYRTHREEYLQQKYVRRARELTSREELERCCDYIKRVRSNKSNKCYYCKKRFYVTPHIDHVIALSRGGKHEIGNLCISCPECNLSKSAKLPSDLDVSQPLLSL